MPVHLTGVTECSLLLQSTSSSYQLTMTELKKQQKVHDSMINKGHGWYSSFAFHCVSVQYHNSQNTIYVNTMSQLKGQRCTETSF